MRRILITNIKIMAILFLFFSASSCRQKKADMTEIQVLINLNVEEKIKNYRRIKMENCRKRALEEAGHMADSILIAQARLSRRDSIDKPPKPVKPDQPEIILLGDSSPIKPFLPAAKKDSLKH